MQLLRAILEWFKQMLQVRLTLPPHRFSRPAMHKQVGLKRLLPHQLSSIALSTIVALDVGQPGGLAKPVNPLPPSPSPDLVTCFPLQPPLS